MTEDQERTKQKPSAKELISGFIALGLAVALASAMFTFIVALMMWMYGDL